MEIIAGKKLHIIDDKHWLKCPRCKGERITEAYGKTDDPMMRVERYSGEQVSIESEDYQVHYDCYVCQDCGCFDFPSVFNNSFRTTKAYCPDCHEEKMYQELEWDDRSGELRIKCMDCGHEYMCHIGRNEEVIEVLEPLYATFDDFYRKLKWMFRNKMYDEQLEDFIERKLATMIRESKDIKIVGKRLRNMFMAIIKAERYRIYYSYQD